jgi:hypothetical protein
MASVVLVIEILFLFLLRLIGQKYHTAAKNINRVKIQTVIISIWAEDYIDMATPYTLVYGEFWTSYF